VDNSWVKMPSIKRRKGVKPLSLKSFEYCPLHLQELFLEVSVLSSKKRPEELENVGKILHFLSVNQSILHFAHILVSQTAAENVIKNTTTICGSRERMWMMSGRQIKKKEKRGIVFGPKIC
jgi:hypothetical protein